MGFFSGKTVYTVNTFSTRVIEDENITDSLRRAVMDSIFTGEEIPESIINSLFQGTGAKAAKMYRHIQKEYPQGLMKTQVVSNRGNAAAIKAAVEADTGRSGIELEYAHLAPLNLHHVTWERLVADYQYDPDSNELVGLSQSLGGTVYLDDFVLLVPQATHDDAEAYGTTWAFGLSPSSGYTPSRPVSALKKYARPPKTMIGEERLDVIARVEYVRQAPKGGVTKGVIELTLVEPAEDDREVFQVMYRHLDKSYFWSYTQGSGQIPALDQLFDVSFTEPGSYMPVIYFRRNHRNLAADSYAGTEEYAAAKKALDLMGMDYVGMSDMIHENEDIGDVRNAYLAFGAPADAEDPLVCRYLYEFFSDLQRRALETALPVTTPYGLPTTEWQQGPDQRYIALRLTPNQDLGDHQIGANMTLSMQSLEAQTKGGKLGKVGTYQLTQETAAFQYEGKVSVYQGEGEYAYEDRIITKRQPVLVLRHQFTASLYREIKVGNPVLRHHIDGSGRGTNNPLGDPDFLIPLDVDLMKEWSLKDQEYLFQRCMYLVFNARDAQKLKWYQSSLFQFALIVIAVVIAAYSGQWQAVSTAMAAGGVAAAAMAILVAVIKMVAMKFAFKLVAKELGAEVALLASVVLAVYSGFRGFQAGSLSKAPWAAEMLQAANGLATAAQTVIQDDLALLSQEYEDLLDLNEEREAELDAAQSLLNTNSHLLSPVSFIWGETPQDFYRRTVHSGNIGVTGFDAVHHFVDLSLRLPEPHTTLGGFAHV